MGIVATWVNIAFSASGLRKLVAPSDVDQFPDEAFRVAMLKRAEAILHDPATPGAPDTWRVGGPGNEADILLIVASDQPAEMERMVERLLTMLALTGASRAIYREYGHVRQDLRGHKHFGFKDGVSQPGVSANISELPDVLLEPQLIAAGLPGADNFSRPGRQLIWPGMSQHPNPIALRLKDT